MFKVRSRCEKLILIGFNWILYNVNEWNKNVNMRIKGFYFVYICVFIYVCLFNKSEGKKKLKLLKSWYGYYRWDWELKCVIIKC